MRGRYRHEPTTGFRYALFEYAEQLLTGPFGAQQLDLSLFPGCDRFNVNSMAAELSGWGDARRLAQDMIEDPDYPWIRGVASNGKTVVHATAVNSAAPWFASRLEQGREQRNATLRAGPGSRSVAV